MPQLESEFPLVGKRSGRCLLGSSFGGVASLSTAYRSPDTYGSLVLHVRIVRLHRHRHRPRRRAGLRPGGEVREPLPRPAPRVADRLFVSCGVYEPLIMPNRSMVPTFESTGMDVRYVEARDGHSWENWRDRLRDALSWIYPGPQKLVYE